MRSSRAAALAVALAAALVVGGAPSVRAASGTKVSGSVDPSLAKSLADAVVFVDEIPGKAFAPKAEPALIEQRQMTFVPHVLPVVRGTTVRFPNVDRVRHNVFSPSQAKQFSFGIYYPRETREIVFDKIGIVTLLCSIHEQMSGFVLVLQNPFFSRVSAEGKYAIPDVPDGNHTVVLWTERGQVRRPVVVKGAPVEVHFTK